MCDQMAMAMALAPVTGDGVWRWEPLEAKRESATYGTIHPSIHPASLSHRAHILNGCRCQGLTVYIREPKLRLFILNICAWSYCVSLLLMRLRLCILCSHPSLCVPGAPYQPDSQCSVCDICYIIYIILLCSVWCECYIRHSSMFFLLFIFFISAFWWEFIFTCLLLSHQRLKPLSVLLGNMGYMG